MFLLFILTFLSRGYAGSTHVMLVNLIVDQFSYFRVTFKLLIKLKQ